MCCQRQQISSSKVLPWAGEAGWEPELEPERAVETVLALLAFFEG